MNIRIANTSPSPQPAAVSLPKSPDIGQAKASTGSAASAAFTVEDKVSLGSGNDADVTYTDPRLSKTKPAPDLAALLEESNRKAQAIVDLIRPLIEQQGLNLAKVVSGEQKLSVDPKTIAAAKAAIAPDGEFGVQKTAERILSFAKAAIGDDPAKLDKIRAAVEQGFKEAADMLGGTLPEISQQTLTAIQTEFDRWKSDGIPSGDTVTLAKTQK
ncbi:MAG: hypothetical protein Q7R66_09580 [Undibacterium sp.]|uniref:hypothetical protein n=1 Tax=Undibacterium sp. TaxID=1914977 RepID=UPI002726C875|nr:hypothetical protein [Undibacterium sp.]MDO8652427.1 hypothetical protein [Undibacterium sp.]